jgi:hypothetical protein
VLLTPRLNLSRKGQMLLKKRCFERDLITVEEFFNTILSLYDNRVSRAAPQNSLIELPDTCRSHLAASGGQRRTSVIRQHSAQPERTWLEIPFKARRGSAAIGIPIAACIDKETVCKRF